MSYYDKNGNKAGQKTINNNYASSFYKLGLNILILIDHISSFEFQQIHLHNIIKIMYFKLFKDKKAVSKIFPSLFN